MRNILRTALLMMGLCLCSSVAAQDWYQLHVSYNNWSWAFPYQMDHVSYFDFADPTTLRMHKGEDEDEIVTPYAIPEASLGTYDSQLDSITFSSTLTEWGKDKYKCFAIYITTDNTGELTPSKTEAKEWVRCYISIDGRGEYPDASGSGRIRGRGNSTLRWYDKKPYRIKFDLTSKVLGIEKNKDWVLLANYRDPTDMMNVFGSLAGKWMGIPFTTPVRFAELFIDGEYKGIYQIAEQVEVGGHRVKIDETAGLLLTLDVDDGPGESPSETNNFWTSVYKMPMAVKNPKDPTAEQLAAIKSEFAELERAIQSQDYAAVDALLDIPSFIAMLQLQEYLFNVELCAPRSVFLFRDRDGKFTFGPAWDWDAGFDFDWGTMYNGHRFFDDYHETVLGSDPYRQRGSYGGLNKFFTDMFGSSDFVRQFKAQWESYVENDSLFTRNWDETQKYVDGLNELVYVSSARTYTSPQQRENERWPLAGYNTSTETTKMKKWLQNRLAYVSELFAGYPTGDEEEVTEPDSYENVGTITSDVLMDYALGYSQTAKVEIDKSELASLLGVQASKLNVQTLDLVPIDADGSEGTNTAAGTYGAWFDADGYTADYSWGDVRVFIESSDLYVWNCGLHPDNTNDGESYTVMMEYRYKTGTRQGKSVRVIVNFQIGEGGGEEPLPTGDWTVKGTLQKSVTMQRSSGYHQDVTIDVDKQEVARLLGVDTGTLTSSTLQLVPLDANDEAGKNTAGKTYGAWFDEDGNTVTYSTGDQCVFIESNDLWSWACGLEQYGAWDSSYNVSMQYRYDPDGDGKGDAVTVKVKFTISGGWW